MHQLQVSRPPPQPRRTPSSKKPGVTYTGKEDGNAGVLDRLESSRGNARLALDGYVYCYASERSKDAIVWICHQRKQMHCNARLTSDDLGVSSASELHMVNPHTHPPDQMMVHKLKFMNSLKERSLNLAEDMSSNDLIDGLLAEFPPELKDHLPARTSLMRMLNKTKMIRAVRSGPAMPVQGWSVGTDQEESYE